MNKFSEIIKYIAGSPERDAMRAKAEGIFGNEFKDTNMYERGSRSAPSLTPPRMYNKGGRVNSYKQEAKELGGHLTDLYIPKEISITEMKEPMRSKKTCRKTCHKKEGGAINNSENRNFLSPKETIYEREMLGERQSRTRPHINYEADMRGEKPVKVAKFAAGGVAKIRHEQSDKRGRPLQFRDVKVK